MNTPEMVLSALGGAAAVIVWLVEYFESGAGFGAVRSVLFVVVAICVFLCYFVVKAARALHQEDVKAWDGYRPLIIGDDRKPRRPNGLRLTMVALFICCLIISLPIVTWRSFPPILTLEIAPIVLVRDTALGPMYGFAGILRAVNNSPSTLHVRQFEIIGEVPVDCFEYYAALGSTSSFEEFKEDVCSKGPYRKLSSVAYPIGPTDADSDGGELFVKVIFKRPEGSPRARIMIGEARDYHGLWSGGIPPKRLTTHPNAEDLIVEMRTNNRRPRKPAIRDGITFRVLVDSEYRLIPDVNIHSGQWATEDGLLGTNPADVFFKAVHGHPIERALENGTDPAIQSR